MKIRRCIYSERDGKVTEKIEDAELVRKNTKSVIVRLRNGDPIKRKMKDVVEW